jgi:hypothetical protein
MQEKVEKSNKKFLLGLFIHSPFVLNIGAHADYINSFRARRKIKWHFYGHLRGKSRVSLHVYDVVAIHCSISLGLEPYTDLALDLSEFNGVKLVFLQDEYRNINATIKGLAASNFTTALCCLPPIAIETLYGKIGIPMDKFISILTGYAPKHTINHNPPKIIDRTIDLSYRGREAPYSWGALVHQKHSLAQTLSARLESQGLIVDISSRDEDRIYGKGWVEFIRNSRVTFGTESGSNILDYDGKIDQLEIEYRKKSSAPTFQGFISFVSTFGITEIHGLTNQISPRIFEAIFHKSALLLVEGTYSGILIPYVHYFPLKEDFENIEEVISFLKNPEAQQEMANKAYKDIILSGKYSYEKLQELIENVVFSNIKAARKNNPAYYILFWRSTHLRSKILNVILKLWFIIPKGFRAIFLHLLRGK